MRRHETIFIIPAALLLGCPANRTSAEGRELAVVLAEAPQDPPEVMGFGTLGPPVDEAVRDPDVAAGLAEAPGGDAEAPLAVAPVADVDGDGVGARDDCDDLDPTVSPLAPEILCDGVDENCNGVDDCDRDGDGFMDVDDPEPDVPNEEPPPDPDAPRWP